MLPKEKPNCLKGSVYPKIGEKDEEDALQEHLTAAQVRPTLVHRVATF
jgi:hypothetical protein